MYTVQESACQLHLSKRDSCHLVALLPEVNYVQFARSVLECMFGFEYDPIVVDFIVRKVCRLPLKNVKWQFKCLQDVAHLPVPALWKDVLTIFQAKKIAMAMIKFCSSEFCISHLPLVVHQLIALKEELCTANLLVGMTQCKHQGWSYISKQYIQFDSKFAIIQHQKTDPLHNCFEQLLSKSMPSTRSCEIFLFKSVDSK